jgi:ribosomal protein S27E
MQKLLNDKYRKSRGGHSKLLQLSCSACDSVLFNYQKDGPGILKRLYIDRIQQKVNSKSKNLSCPSCSETLGNLMNYKKEDRAAYRLFVGAVAKKIIKSK